MIEVIPFILVILQFNPQGLDEDRLWERHVYLTQQECEDGMEHETRTRIETAQRRYAYSCVKAPNGDEIRDIITARQ